MRLLIATAQRPATEEKAFAFNECIRKSASEASLFIPQGILWTEGPGCANLAFDIEGGEDECNNFGKILCMHMQPAKWCETPDALPERDTFNLKPLN